MVDYAELRRNMVDNQIRTVDVIRLSVLQAFLDVPREIFVPENLRDRAYLDTDIRLTPASATQVARYLMEPAPMAKLLQLADIRESDSVLDIGAVTGYCAALLSRLASSVVAIEADDFLAKFASDTLQERGVTNVKVYNRPLTSGYMPGGPYHAIIIEGAVDLIPQQIFDQLREGGRLVVVEGHGNAGAAKLYTRHGAIVSSRRAFNLAVKPLEGFLREPEFVFN